MSEFPSWLSSNKSDWHPGGYEFDPWPHSVGSGSSAAASYGVACRCGSDAALLWLSRRPATEAPIQPLAWELLDAAGVALGSKKNKKNQKPPGPLCLLPQLVISVTLGLELPHKESQRCLSPDPPSSKPFPVPMPSLCPHPRPLAVLSLLGLLLPAQPGSLQ